jgi:hypothetical protein
VAGATVSDGVDDELSAVPRQALEISQFGRPLIGPQTERAGNPWRRSTVPCGADLVVKAS